MIEFNIIHVSLFLSLVLIQTVVGVGVLVLGTPILLILNYNIVETISILLPISILTSLMNLIFFKFVNKIPLLGLGSKVKKSFFTICIPAILFGTMLLKYFHEVINFKILVSALILTTLIVKKFFNNHLLILSNSKKIRYILKVLQVIPKLGYGGAETGCYDIAHYLPENNCKSFIATSGGELLKFVDKKKVKVFRLPVHSKNPLLILVNTLILIGIILINNISIVHARSRAPAWSCLIATKITRRKFVTTFHGTYNFNSSLKKWYNSVMVRSDLVIAGSNFIFSHINENYSKYLLHLCYWLV